MFCIIAFIVFLLLYPILGIFSADYRYLFRKSFQCFFNRVTFKTCDVDLKTEIKGRLLGKVIIKYPKFGKYFDKSFDIIAFLFVVLSIWSLIYSATAGLNLFVYDTCNPETGESCSLSGEACGVASDSISFSQAIDEGKIVEWAIQPVTTLGKTISLIPNRVKNWEAKDYVGPTPSYALKYDSNKPVALEIIDPGCKFCRQLYLNIKESGFKNRYNLSYLIYPIPDKNSPSGYKFSHSYLMASYLESAKTITLENQEVSGDWYLMDAIFTRSGKTSPTLQDDINFIFDDKETEKVLQDLLKEYGYSDDQVALIAQKANSEATKQTLEKQKSIVENDIKTIRIPTIMFNGRRYDKAVDKETLTK